MLQAMLWRDNFYCDILLLRVTTPQVAIENKRNDLADLTTNTQDATEQEILCDEDIEYRRRYQIILEV